MSADTTTQGLLSCIYIFFPFFIQKLAYAYNLGIELQRDSTGWLIATTLLFMLRVTGLLYIVVHEVVIHFPDVNSSGILHGGNALAIRI